MKTAKQILEENKSRMVNVISLSAAHARLGGLFIHLAMYKLFVDLDNNGRKSLSLSIYCRTDEEKELVDVILSNYNLQGMEVETIYFSESKTNCITITCKY